MPCVATTCIPSYVYAMKRTSVLGSLEPYLVIPAVTLGISEHTGCALAISVSSSQHGSAQLILRQVSAIPDLFLFSKHLTVGFADVSSTGPGFQIKVKSSLFSHTYIYYDTFH